MNRPPVAPQDDDDVWWNHAARDAPSAMIREIAADAASRRVSLRQFARLAEMDHKNLERALYSRSPRDTTIARLRAAIGRFDSATRLDDEANLDRNQIAFQSARATFRRAEATATAAQGGASRDADDAALKSRIAYLTLLNDRRNLVRYTHLKLWRSQRLTLAVARVDDSRPFVVFNGREYPVDEPDARSNWNVGDAIVCEVADVIRDAEGAPQLDLRIVA